MIDEPGPSLLKDGHDLFDLKDLLDHELNQKRDWSIRLNDFLGGFIPFMSWVVVIVAVYWFPTSLTRHHQGH